MTSLNVETTPADDVLLTYAAGRKGGTAEAALQQLVDQSLAQVALERLSDALAQWRQYFLTLDPAGQATELARIAAALV